MRKRDWLTRADIAADLGISRSKFYADGLHEDLPASHLPKGKRLLPQQRDEWLLTTLRLRRGPGYSSVNDFYTLLEDARIHANAARFAAAISAGRKNIDAIEADHRRITSSATTNATIERIKFKQCARNTILER